MAGSPESVATSPTPHRFAAQVGLCERFKKPKEGKHEYLVMLRLTGRYGATEVSMTWLPSPHDLPHDRAAVAWQSSRPTRRGEQTGGFHTHFQETHPVVRTRWDDNSTVPSELLIELLNLLGRWLHTGQGRLRVCGGQPDGDRQREQPPASDSRRSRREGAIEASTKDRLHPNGIFVHRSEEWKNKPTKDGVRGRRGRMKKFPAPGSLPGKQDCSERPSTDVSSLGRPAIAAGLTRFRRC